MYSEKSAFKVEYTFATPKNEKGEYHILMNVCYFIFCDILLLERLLFIQHVGIQ